MDALVRPSAAEYNSIHDKTLQHTTTIGLHEKSHDSLNLTLLWFTVFGA